MRRRGWAALWAAVLFLVAFGAAADTYPSRTINLVVPFPAGSTTDLVGRIVANELGKRLGQQVVIDNRGGAGGLVGAEYVARAAPDGYTLLLGTISSHSIVPHLVKKMPYDALADFTPIAQCGSLPNVLAVHPSLPVKSVPELVEHARANPGKLNYGSSGNGTTAHLAGALFGTRMGVSVVHVPYRGGGQAVTDLLSGELAFMLYQYMPMLPHIASGKLRALAVTAPTRVPALPDLPTMMEAGVPDFDVTAWLAFYGPAKLAPAQVTALNSAVVAVLGTPAVRESLLAQGVAPVSGSPDDLLRLNKAELVRWGKVVKESGVQID